MCSQVLKNGKPPDGPAGTPAQRECGPCPTGGTGFGARGCTVEGLCTTDYDKTRLRRLGLLLLKGGKKAEEEPAGISEAEAERRVNEMMPRVRELLDTYININRILNEVKAAHEAEIAEPFIECDMIWNVYAINSYINRRDMDDIEKGVERIYTAYAYARKQFAEAAAADSEKLYRKDGRTPIFAHSTRLAMMAAYLGARSDMIAGLLCHDLVEDCKVTSSEVRREIRRTIGKTGGDRIRTFVTLLTKPVLTEIEAITQTINGEQRKERTRMWVTYIENPFLWGTCTPLPCRERYTERMNLHYDSILNANPENAPVDIRLQAFVGKMLDALDNLITDEYLDPVNATLRREVLVLQTRHLEVLAPGLRDIFVKILGERGYIVPEKRTRWEPKEGEIVLQPPVDKINVAALDGSPAPNGYITIYADDEKILEQIAAGNYIAPLRVELPHTARPDSCVALAEFFKKRYPDVMLSFERGESLLPCGSEAAGTIIMVNGINDAKKFEVLKTGLSAFYVMCPQMIGRTVKSAEFENPEPEDLGESLGLPTSD